jgi:hypothetical protein
VIIPARGQRRARAAGILLRRHPIDAPASETAFVA